MGCPDCLARTFFTILTLSTIGVTTAVIIFLFIIVEVEGLNLVSQTVKIYLIIALVVSVLILIFAIIASCCGRKCLRCFLAIFYLIFAAAIAGFAVLVALHHDNFVASLDSLWASDASPLPEKIEEAFECRCFNSSGNVICLQGENVSGFETCDRAIQKVIDEYWESIFGFAVGAAGLLLLAAIIALAYVCCCKKDQPYGINYGYRFLSAP
jgi:hypothetical protein